MMTEKVSWLEIKERWAWHTVQSPGPRACFEHSRIQQAHGLRGALCSHQTFWFLDLSFSQSLPHMTLESFTWAATMLLRHSHVSVRFPGCACLHKLAMHGYHQAWDGFAINPCAGGDSLPLIATHLPLARDSRMFPSCVSRATCSVLCPRVLVTDPPCPCSMHRPLSSLTFQPLGTLSSRRLTCRMPLPLKQMHRIIVSAVRYSRIHNSSGQSPYTVKVKGMRYGSQEILFFGDGGADSMDATFDTGSDCVMLPDMAFGALEASPFRTLLEAHVKHGHQTLSFVLTDAEGGELTLSLPYQAWTHPGGCLGPYKGHNIVLGLPIFRQYLVVHDLSASQFRIGIAPRNPEYEMGKHARNWEYGGDSSLLEEDSGGYIAGRQLLKLRLSTDGGRPARRYMLGIGVGTPAQTLPLAVDTGSYQVNIKRWHAGEEESQKSEEQEKKASAAKRKSAAIEKLKKKAKGQRQKVSKGTNTKAGHDKKESRAGGGKGAKGSSSSSSSSTRSGSSSSSSSSSNSSRKRHDEHKKQAAQERLKAKPSKQGGTPPSEEGDDRGDESERGRGQVGNARGLSAAQVACLVVAGIAAGLLLLFEVRRQRMTSVKRFRLVDYSHGLPDGTSRIQFSDCE